MFTHFLLATDEDDPKSGFSVDYDSSGIIVYRFADMYRVTIDDWFTMTHQHEQQAFADKGHLCRLYLLEQALGSTFYAIQKTIEADQLHPPELMSSNVVVLPDALGFRLISGIILHRISLVRSQVRAMRSEDQARAWLAERIQTYGTAWRAPQAPSPDPTSDNP